jgi:hypothetical protein
MVEYELTFELVKLHILAIEFGGDVGLPVFGDLGKFLGDVDFGHGILDGSTLLKIRLARQFGCQILFTLWNESGSPGNTGPAVWFNSVLAVMLTL